MAIVKKDLSVDSLFSQITSFSGDIYRIELGKKVTKNIIATDIDDFDGQEGVVTLDSKEVVEGVNEVFYNKRYVTIENSGSGSAIGSGSGSTNTNPPPPLFANTSSASSDDDGDTPPPPPPVDFVVKTYENASLIYPELTIPTLDNGIKIFSRTVYPSRIIQFKKQYGHVKGKYKPDKLPDKDEYFTSKRTVDSTQQILTYSV